MNTTYDLAKKVIVSKALTKGEVSKRINMFYMFSQISEKEYEELMVLIETKYAKE